MPPKNLIVSGVKKPTLFIIREKREVDKNRNYKSSKSLMKIKLFELIFYYTYSFGLEVPASISSISLSEGSSKLELLSIFFFFFFDIFF